MKISKQRLLDLGLPYACEGGKILKRSQCDHSRWTVGYEVLFQLPEQVGTDRALLTYYDAPATEMQEGGPEPYEFDPDEVDLCEVERRECTIIAWAPLNWDGKLGSLTL